MTDCENCLVKIEIIKKNVVGKNMKKSKNYQKTQKKTQYNKTCKFLMKKSDDATTVPFAQH